MKLSLNMDQTALISSAEEQLKSYGNFLTDNDTRLNGFVEKTLNTSCTSYTTHNYVDTPLVSVNYSANQEVLPLLRLLESDRELNKTLLTFAHLCAEVDVIVSEARRMVTKFLYLDEELRTMAAMIGRGTNSEKLLLTMSKSIEFLCQMQFLLQRFIVVGNNILHQCGAYLAYQDATLEFRFFDVFDRLAELLLQLLIFDKVLSTSCFLHHWTSYKKTVAAIARNSDCIQQCSAAELNGLQNCMEEVDFLFCGNVFLYFLQSTNVLQEKIGSKGIGQLVQQCNEYMKQQLVIADKFSAGDLNDFVEPHLLVRLNAFCTVFYSCCGQVEPKHVRHLVELNTRHQGIMLVGNVDWTAAPFLEKHAPKLVEPYKRLLLDNDMKRQRQQFLQTRVQMLPRDCRAHSVQVSLWALQVRRALSAGPFELTVEQFKDIATLLLHGMRQAGQISYLVKGLVHAHVVLQAPMSKTTLLAVCKLIEMIKIIQLTAHQNTSSIARIMHCILQYLQHKVLHLLSVCKKKITSSSAKLHDRNVDALAAIKMAERCMTGPPSRQRLLVTKLAVSATNVAHRTLSSDQYERFKALLQRMEVLGDFQQHLQQVCDTSFLYWHQSLLTGYLKQIVDRKLDFHSFRYLIEASNACGKTLDLLKTGDGCLDSNALKKSHFECLRAEIVSNLCAQIETYLRLEVHSNLQLERINPFERGINDYRDLIAVCPIELNGHHVIIKDHVENYLSAMFYNLTTISLHDWKTYEKMRHLANNRLMLKPVEDYLPNQTLEQGIDILEIMRNIHIFVSRYAYNMNQQIFVEQQSANKHLDSIGIRHVANSLRTHGAGVINTTVNFTYQFLRQKFYTFSQFLYDEQIKSRLMKELRAYADRKQSDQYPLYPYDRADAFNKEIRKLGLATNDGQTYMDLFRKVITHVGNAMGYIRLVRSGAIHANFNASLYLPKFDEQLGFVDACRKAQLRTVTIEAAENFEINVRNLAQSFSDSTDYFKLLVEAFLPFFQNPHNHHLRNFFLIVPPLTLNYVQHMLSVREKVNKKDRHGVVLFDDGFAIGLTYILRLLDQIADLNALQWFTTVRARFDAERRKIKQMLDDITRTSSNAKSANASENEKLQQTLALTERRVSVHQMEFNLLYYNLSSAKIFFQ